MCPEKFFALGIIFVALNPVPSLPAPTQMHNNGAFDSLKILCKTVCAEAKGNSKFHDASLTCFCEVSKTTADATVNLLTKKAQENGMSLKFIKRNPNVKRETNILDLAGAPTVLEDKILSSAEERWVSSPSNFETVLGQAPPNILPRRQQQVAKGPALLKSTKVSNQRPPLLSNRKTSPLPDSIKEPEAPNPKRETDMKDIFGENIPSKIANKRQFDFDNFLGEASPIAGPQRQQQIVKGPARNESPEVSSQRPPNISDKETLALSDVVDESEPKVLNSWKEIDMHHIFDDKVSQVPPRVDFEDMLGQASPNTVPQGQHQNISGSSLAELTEASDYPNGKDFGDDLGLASPNTLPQHQQHTESNEFKLPKGESANSNNQRPPNISNEKTSETRQSIETTQEESLSFSGQTMQPLSPSLKEMNNFQNDGVGPKITKRNSQLERDDKVSREKAEGVPGQTSPLLSTSPEESSNQRPPIIGNKKTPALTEEVKEPEDLQLIPSGKPKGSSSSPTTVNFVGASSGLLVNMVDEEEPTSSSKQTMRRSTPSPRKSPPSKRTYNNEPIRRALESARQHIDTLIQRTNQPSFNPSVMGAEIEAICASLRSVSHRVNESSRNLERSALMEQIRERERERHARIHSRFGGHEDRPRKLKPLLVGTANPKDKGAASKTEEAQEKKDDQKESGAQKAPTIITQPSELVEN